MYIWNTYRESLCGGCVCAAVYACTHTYSCSASREEQEMVKRVVAEERGRRVGAREKERRGGGRNSRFLKSAGKQL